MVQEYYKQATNYVVMHVVIKPQSFRPEPINIL